MARAKMFKTPAPDSVQKLLESQTATRLMVDRMSLSLTWIRQSLVNQAEIVSQIDARQQREFKLILDELAQTRRVQSSCSRPANPNMEPNHIGAVGLNEIAVRWIVAYVREQIAKGVTDVMTATATRYGQDVAALMNRIARLENNQQRFR